MVLTQNSGPSTFLTENLENYNQAQVDDDDDFPTLDPSQSIRI